MIFKAIEARQAMERTFQSQLEEISGKIEELVSEDHTASLLCPAIPFQQGFLNQINVRSERLSEFDVLATNALEERDLRYKAWKAWNPNAVPLPRFRLGTRPRVPPTSAESTLVAAYDHTGQIQGFLLISIAFSNLCEKIWQPGDVSATQK